MKVTVNNPNLGMILLVPGSCLGKCGLASGKDGHVLCQRIALIHAPSRAFLKACPESAAEMTTWVQQTGCQARYRHCRLS